MAQIAVRVLAQQCARKAVRDNLRQRGVKLSYVSAKEIIAEARAKAASLGYGADI